MNNIIQEGKIEIMKSFNIFSYLLLIFTVVSCIGDPVENAQERERLESIRLANPSITNITTNVSDGSYTTGQNIDITLSLSKSVTTSTSSISLNNAASASYLSGSGTDQITFRYTIAASDDISLLEISTINVGDTRNSLGKPLDPSIGAGLELNGRRSIEIDTTAPSIVSITSTLSDNQYGIGDVIDIIVTFDETVSTSTSSLTLDSGGTASYSSGSGTSQITYSYTISASENSSDLNVSTFNVGDLTDDVSIASTASLPVSSNLSDNKDLIIDTTSPTITNISSTILDGTYGLGQNIDIDVTFDEIVTTSTSSLSLDNGATASYLSGSGTSIITYRYTVAATESSADLNVSSITIGDSQDLVANIIDSTIPASDLATNKAIIINTTPPSITGITSAIADGLYSTGQDIDIVVSFSEIVNLSNTTLSLDTSGVASYLSGSGTNSITFRYTISAGESSLDLDVSSITAGDALSAYGNPIDTTLPGANLATSKAIVIDTISPTITNITSTTPGDGLYSLGQVIEIIVTFSEPVNTTGSSLTLFNGASAVYFSGSTTTSTIYRYTVSAGENSSDLNVQTFNSGGSTDIAGNSLTTSIPGGTNLADNQAIIIDTLDPSIVSIDASTPGNGSYNSGDTIDIILTFNENVISSTSTITLDTGDVVSLTSGSTTNTLLYQYTIGAGDNSSDLSVVSFSAGDTRDNVNNNAPTTLPGGLNLSDTQDIIVDTLDPTITSISATEADNTYGLGAVINITVDFSEAVYATSSTLTLDTGAVVALSSGSGTTTHTYSYTVGAGENSPLLDVTTFNIGDAADNAGNNLVSTLPVSANLADNKAIVIDTTAPTITNITSALADGSYTTTNSVDVDVTFDKVINTTSSSILLNNGATANYFSGSGSSTITYRYTVAASEDTADLDVTTFNLGDATDIVLNAPDVTLPVGQNLADNKDIAIDTIAPSITNITTILADGSYGVGQIVNIDITFDEIVTTSTSSIVLDTGATVTYTSGSGTNTITYSYTVSASEDSLNLNVTTFNVGDTADAVLLTSNSNLPPTSNLADNKAIVIDTTAPTITNITSALADGAYTTGQIVDIDVTFDEAVTISSGSLTLDNTGVANYFSGSTTNTITYRYTAGASEDTSDLNVTSISIGDAADNLSNSINTTLPTLNNLADNKSIVIDSSAPIITNISSSKIDSTYGIGEIIDIEVTFNESVSTTSASLTLDNGAAANYQSGSGTSSIIFRYTVAASQDSPDLTVTTVNSGDAANAVGLALDNTLPPGANLADSKDIIIDTSAPNILSINSTLADGTYGVGQSVDVIVNLDENVTTTNATLTMDTGAIATYISGSGSSTLTFQYTVLATNSSLDLDVSAITVNDAEDIYGNPIDTTLPGSNLANNKAIVIDTTQPTIANTTSSIADGSYGVSQTIDISITFSKIVLTNTSSITLDSGGSASYLSGSGTNTIVYRYIVGATQSSLDLDLTSITAGDAQDSFGNPISTLLSGTTLATNKNIIIDSQAPSITNANSILADGTYGIGQVIDIVVTFDEVVTTSTSSLVLNSSANATYLSGSGTSSITYRYTVASTESSSDLDISSIVVGDAADAAGNPISSVISGTTLASNKALVIDGAGPIALSISSSLANGTYGISQVIDIVVTYDENVTTTNSSLTLDNGATANYLSGSGTTNITYRYTVGPSEDSADLDVSIITAGDGVDAQSNTIDTTLPALNLAVNKAIVIASATPEVDSISPLGGPNTGGTLVTINGSNFNLALTSSDVQLGGSNCTISSVSQSQIICTTTAHANGFTDVVVTNPDTQSGTLPNGFLYSDPITIDSISQTSGSITGGDTITVTGTGFDFPDVGLTSVNIGGASCSSVSVTSPTNLSCTTTASSAGTYDVTVSQLYQNATLASSFTYISGPVLTWQVGAGDPNPPNPADWGTPSANETWTFTLENTGTTVSSTISLSVTGTNAIYWSFGTDNCSGTTLLAAETCTVQVNYLWALAPAASGTHTATLNATATSGGTSTNALTGSKP